MQKISIFFQFSFFNKYVGKRGILQCSNHGEGKHQEEEERLLVKLHKELHLQGGYKRSNNILVCLACTKKS